MKPVIEFTGVSKQFGGKTVLRNLNLTINEGEFFVIVGPSGSGKTTTLKMINALIEPDGGDIHFNGRRIKDHDIRLLRRRIGYVLQQIALFPTMTVGQNIGLMPEILGWKKSERQHRIRELLETAGLPPEKYAHRRPHQLSGGEQQRIGILRAIAHKPDVLLMDEPFSALDPLSRTALQDTAADIHRRLGTTIVFVTHDMNEAVRLADRIAVMKNGGLQQVGTPEALQTRPATPFVRSFFQSTRTDYGKISALTDRWLPFSGDHTLPAVSPDAPVDALFPLLARHPRVRITGLGEADAQTVFACLAKRG